MRNGNPFGVVQKEWLREGAAPDQVILARVISLIAVARDPLAHLRERSGSVRHPKRVPHRRSWQDVRTRKDTAANNEVSRRVELEQK